ncbi:MAG: hydroxymethylbilane synthase, partial [Planctomycetota bacterium]
RRWAEAIDHADARAAVSAERALLQAIGADCHSCVGVHVHRSGAAWRARAMAADDAGRPVHVVAGADALGDLPAALAARLRGGAAGAAH